MYNLEQNPDRLKVTVPAEGTSVNLGQTFNTCTIVLSLHSSVHLICHVSNTHFCNELLCVLIKPLHTSVSFDLILLQDEINLKVIRN
jgi:hypothetical protein